MSASPLKFAAESGKIVSAEEAVRLIRDGDTVATGGFVGIGFAEEIAVALEQHYLREPASRATLPWSMRRARATARNAGSIISAATGWCAA